MRQIICFALLLWHGLYTAHAQQYFNRRYSLHSGNTQLGGILPYGNKYYCTGWVTDSSNFVPGVGWPDHGQGIKFCVLDSMGNVLLDTVYQKPLESDFCVINHSLAVLDTDKLILACNYDYNYGVTNRLLGHILQYDTLGNVLWDTTYDKPLCVEKYYWNSHDFIRTNTGEWLLLSHSDCYDSSVPVNLQRAIILTKLDSAFRPIWSKEYGEPHENDQPRRIIVTKDNNYLIAGHTDDYNWYGPYPGAHYKAELIKIDTGGNVLWTWQSDTTKQTGRIYDVIETKDGGYIYCGEGNGYEEEVGAAGIVKTIGWIEKLDSARHRVWYDTAGRIYADVSYYGLKTLIELEDSSVVVGGDMIGGLNEDTIAEITSYAYLARYKPNGEVVWKRKHSYNTDSLVNYVNNVKRSWDGGYVMCGSSNDVLGLYSAPGVSKYQGWVLKVDSNGCSSLTDPQCRPSGVQDVGGNGVQVSVYPNPAKGVLHINPTEKLPLGSVFQLSDMAGVQVRSVELNKMATTLDISGMSSGMYLYRILVAGVQWQVGKVVKE